MHVFRISIEFTTKGAVVNARVFINIQVDSFVSSFLFLFFCKSNICGNPFSLNAIHWIFDRKLGGGLTNDFFNIHTVLSFFEDTEYVMPWFLFLLTRGNRKRNKKYTHLKRGYIVQDAIQLPILHLHRINLVHTWIFFKYESIDTKW